MEKNRTSRSSAFTAQRETKFWPLGSDGEFIPQQLSVQDDNPLHCRAIQISKLVVERLPGCTVYIRGSAIVEPYSDRIADIDLITLTREKLRNTRDLFTIDDLGKSLPPIDMAVADVKRLCSSFRSELGLMLAFQSLRLIGPPGWTRLPVIKPDLNLFKDLLQQHVQHTCDQMTMIARDQNRADYTLFAPWILKRIARLGGLLYLKEGRFTRDICLSTKKLASEIPELETRINQAVESLFTRQQGLIIYEKGRDLYLAIIARLTRWT